MHIILLPVMQISYTPLFMDKEQKILEPRQPAEDTLIHTLMILYTEMEEVTVYIYIYIFHLLTHTAKKNILGMKLSRM